MAKLIVTICLFTAYVASTATAAFRSNGAQRGNKKGAEAVRVQHMRTVYNKKTGLYREEVFESDASDVYLQKAVNDERAARKGAASGSSSGSTVSFAFPPLATDEDWISRGSFAETMLDLGWNLLDIETNGERTDEEQAYYGGKLEGHLTALQIRQHMFNRYNDDPVPQNVLDFFTAQDKWVLEMIEKHGSGGDKFWTAAKLMRRQLQGMLDGATPYNTTEFPPLTFQSLMTVVAMGDIFDLIPALNPSLSERPENDWRAMGRARFEEWFTMNGHCSAAVSVADDFSDLFFGHSSWYVYTATLRIFKRFSMNYRSTASRKVTFSSYPGMLSSFDDFLISERNIMALETSLSVFNTSLYRSVTPQSALYWMRNMAANYMATNAREWGELYSRHHSGTYNSQWLVLDLNLFTPHSPLKPNTLWITEETPGLIVSRDVTEILSFGYFPSYNVPLIKEVYDRLGYPEAVALKGPAMTDYSLCVRAQIFRRDAARVQSLKEFQHLLQYNDYETDPISKGNPYYAIASRVDLSTPAPRCFGAIDSKTSSWTEWMRNGNTILAFSGPTPQQATFSFETTKAVCKKHVGLPSTYNFPYLNMSLAKNFPTPQNL